MGAVSEALREEFFVATGTHRSLVEAPGTFTKGERQILKLREMLSRSFYNFAYAGVMCYTQVADILGGSSMKSAIVAVSLACLITASSFAESFPPGKYQCIGRVVKRDNGEILVFNGGTPCFPKKLQEQLKPYVGTFARITYMRVSQEEAGILSPEGSVIGSIENVTVLANNPAELPLQVILEPTKREFDFAEPISATITVKNQSDSTQTLVLRCSRTGLYRNYRQSYILEGDNHYWDKKPYGIDYVPTLKPGEELQLKLTSVSMADPGDYQMVFILCVERAKLECQSEVVEVKVHKPESEAEEVAGLKAWLRRATKGQRIEIAKRLLKHGEECGTEEVLRLLKAGEYSKENYCNSAAFRFAWRHGGEKGKKIMLKLILGEKNQEHVLRMIEDIYLSPRRLDLLEKLLKCKKLTYRGISGWVDKPRVCDITAAWLCGYTDGKLVFPKKGPPAKRDNVVKQVLARLRDEPPFFEVLSRPHK